MPISRELAEIFLGHPLKGYEVACFYMKDRHNSVRCGWCGRHASLMIDCETLKRTDCVQIQGAE